MRILIFSRDPRRFHGLKRRKSSAGLVAELFPLQDLPGTLPDLKSGTLVYLDVSGLGERETERLVETLAKSVNIHFGIVDPAGTLSDVATLFHRGAVDYIGRKLLRTGFAMKRLSRILSYARGAVDGFEEEKTDGSPRAPTNGWAGIVDGVEHPFAFLLVDADEAEELKKRHEPGNLAHAIDTFRAYLGRIVEAHGGRVWLNTEFGALALFPLGGNDRCAATVCGLKILMSRVFYEVEESLLPGFLSFRMALAVGSTVYREENTGKIVSDSLNSIFHLGQRYTKPGQFYLTADALDLAPRSLQSLCIPAGTFEGKRIYKMLNPSAAGL